MKVLKNAPMIFFFVSSDFAYYVYEEFDNLPNKVGLEQLIV